MRIHFRGIAHPTTLAKSLKRELAAHGREVGIRTCEQHIAGMTGYANWHELRKVNKGREAADPTDQEAGPKVAADRSRQYVAFLAPLYGHSVAVDVVKAINPTGSGARVPAVEAPPAPALADGEYPFSFAHAVETDDGRALVRSEGRIRIPSSRRTDPVFSGGFLTPRESVLPRPPLARLDIHEVDGILYSRLGPVLNTPLPEGFGRKGDLADILLWRREPSQGVAGHPLVQALAFARHSAPPNLVDHVCPPDWRIDLQDGSRDPYHLHAALYGGVRDLYPCWPGLRGKASSGAAKEGAPASLQGIEDLAARGVRILRSDEDRIRAEIAKATEGHLVLVGDEVMLRTPEPCWKLSMGKGGHLMLDLYLSGYLRGREAYGPTLFFALDETEARDRAVASLLGLTGQDGPAMRGTLDSMDASACAIDGNASSVAYLASCMRESLTQAAKVLPDEAAQAAETLRARLPVVGYPNLAGFVRRGTGGDAIDEGIMDGWQRLDWLAGGEIRVDSEIPALASLAGHGVFLMYLASSRNSTPAAAQPQGPGVLPIR